MSVRFRAEPEFNIETEPIGEFNNELADFFSPVSVPASLRKDYFGAEELHILSDGAETVCCTPSLLLNSRVVDAPNGLMLWSCFGRCT